ncbi:DUF6339 family protein [Streptomyces sp. NRRL F-2295]|uniref:DUF6339 family protein n=1 Tax=Streptomyces sp. NRRL F-2295 TaxID=1519477 RepID=UPI000A905AE4|nr:DUF6339 family protein [Streptomyces sp. NRRL F-2295]
MPRATPHDIPPVLGLLPDAVVAKYLSHAIQSGQETPPQVALRKAATLLHPTEARRHTTPLRQLLEEAMRRFDDQRTAADAWLAPRLHATLRLTRAEAADGRLWNYLALLVAPDYVLWRHQGTETTATSRFSGAHYTQAFSRLWWAAELFRDGADYRPVETACRVQDVLNTTLRLDVIDHRPTALAIVRVLDRLIADGIPRPGDHVNALSSAVNTAGSTLVYDVLAPDPGGEGEAVLDWIAEAQDAPAVPFERLPDGPDDGRVSAQSVDTLVALFGKLLAEAPRRQRPTLRPANPSVTP